MQEVIEVEIQNLNFDIQTNMAKESKTSTKNQSNGLSKSEDSFSKYITESKVKSKQQGKAKEEVKKANDIKNKVEDTVKEKDIDQEDGIEGNIEKSLDKKEPSQEGVNNVITNIYSLIESLQTQPEMKSQLKALIEALISGDNATINALKETSNGSKVNSLNEIINASNNNDLSSILKQLSSLEDGNSKNTLFDIEALLKNLANENLENQESSLGVAKNDSFSSLENELISKLRANLKNKIIDEQASGHQEGVINIEPLNDFKPHINIYDKNLGKNGVIEKNLVKENNILEKLSEGEKNDSKISRISNFLTTLSDKKVNLNTSAINNSTPIYISKGSFNEDVVKAIKFMSLNNLKDLSVKIYPKELGEVVISVSMEQGGLKAVIKAANKDTVDLLNLGLRDINDKLSQNNVKIQSLDIALYNEDTTFFANGNKQQQQQQFNENNNKKFTLDIEEEKINEVVEDGAVNLLI